jgi:hypothetical protein
MIGMISEKNGDGAGILNSGARIQNGLRIKTSSNLPTSRQGFRVRGSGKSNVSNFRFKISERSAPADSPFRAKSSPLP